MGQVRVAASAADNLRAMMRSHSLPADTPTRVQRRIAPLAQFPMMGPALAGRWDGYRFILGPWRWLVVIYEVIDGDVAVVSFQDARSSRAATGARR